MCSTTDWRYCLRHYSLFKFIDSLCISCCKIEHTFHDSYNLFVIIWYYGLSKCRVTWRMWGAKWMKQFKLVMSVSSPYLHSWDNFRHTLQSNWLESNWSGMNLFYLTYADNWVEIEMFYEFYKWNVYDEKLPQSYLEN